MPTPSELQAYLELEKERDQLAQRVDQLEAGLKRLKKVFESEPEIIISFAGDRNEPHRDVRLYTMKGMALGFGKMKLNEEPAPGKQDDLFAPVQVGLTYSATIKVKELFDVGKR